MNNHRRLLLVGAGGLLAKPSLAQPRFPERPIEIVVGFTPGGGTDLMARTFARFLESRIGGSVVVQNRPGAGGEVAFSAVARSRPDGHTLIATTMPAFLTIPIERTAQYQAAQFAPVALIVSDPSCIAVHEQSPIRSLAYLIDHAKRQPEHLTFGSPGIGTDDHLQLVLLEFAAGIRLTSVNFPGSAQIRSALLGAERSVQAWSDVIGVTRTFTEMTIWARTGARVARWMAQRQARAARNQRAPRAARTLVSSDGGGGNMVRQRSMELS